MTTYGAPDGFFLGLNSTPPGFAVSEVAPPSTSTGSACLDDSSPPPPEPEPHFEAKWHMGDLGTPVIPYSAQEKWLDSVLNDPRGWTQANIRFTRTASEGVSFLYVPYDVLVDLCGWTGPGTLGGCSNPVDGGAGGIRVLIDAAKFGPGATEGGTGVPLHEAAHAFFGAQHDGTGIMVGEGGGFPDAADIADLRTWLGI